MTFKKRYQLSFIGLFLFLLACVCTELTVCAKEEKTILPEGEILIVYSDAAKEEELAGVQTLVEELTFQNFQVTFAPATECVDNLDTFSSIILYQIRHCPKMLFDSLYAYEQEDNRSLQSNTAVEKDASKGVKGDRNILFIGNDFLKEYMKHTGRLTMLSTSEAQVGRVCYEFDYVTKREVLVKEEGFVFLKGELDEERGQVYAESVEGYLYGRKGCLSHISVSELTHPTVKAAVSKEISLWKWPYLGEPHIYAQFIVLNKVYPFQNPDRLQEVVNYLIDKREPFVISVMPVYENGDYPAMQRFCEVLRYAQANGGVVLLHTPINQMPSIDTQLVNEYMTKAIRIYMDHGVYPMGVQAPANWMHDSRTMEILNRFRTILVDEEEDVNVFFDPSARTNVIYKDGHQWIAPAITLEENGAACLRTYSSAVYIDITDPMEEVESHIQNCISSEVPLKSLWDVEHSLWTDEDVVTYRNHIIAVNGKRAQTDFEATVYDENYAYNRNMLQRFSKDLTNENKKLIVAVVVISVLFLLFISMARRNNRRRFVMKNGGDYKEDKDDSLPEEKP